TIKGDFSNSGALSASNRKITFSGSTQNTSALINDNTVDLVVNKSSTGGITFQGASSFDQVTVTDGYLDIGAYTFTANNTISIAAAGTLKIPNSGTFNADGQLTTSGEIDFTGSGSQGDLICSNTSANTFGTMDDAAGTVTFDGGSSQAIPSETFFNLKNSNTNGLTLSGDATVEGELNLNVAADITTGANTLTIGSGGSIANAAADRHINVDNTSGYLGKTFGSGSAFSYPVGNGTILRPIRLTTDAGSTTFKLRYDDNRFTGAGVGAASGNVSGGGFASGHISGFDGSNTDITKGYYYDVRKTSGSANASLYVSWTDDDDYGTNGNVFGPDLTGIAWGTWNGSRWDDISSTASGNINIGNITTASAVTDFSGFFFTLGSTDGENNLPIDLMSFEGECMDNQTNLEFVVASQVNNEYFTIERSKNLFSWEKLGDITGGGTNNEETTYSYKDVSPNSGDNYYRLSQTDIDGTTESFSPIVVNCDSKVDNYRIYPNPTTNLITIEFELEYFQGDNIQLVLRDLKGTNLKTTSVALSRGYNSFNVDLSELPKGFYIIQFQGTKNHIPERRVVKL
ncbi:MAG: T9SS type A sorting domain-containing protein, partial [Flavobacteriales bacterium]|nr:T9SS type A sorting domain-containing protein [Flavobacteriales bacterium]